MYTLLLAITLFSTHRASPVDTALSPQIDTALSRQSDSAFVTIQNHSTEGFSISLTNDYADEEAFYFKGLKTVGIPVSQFRFVMLMGTGRLIRIPCFAGDTTIYDFDAPGLKFQVSGRTLKVYDTIFFSRASNWNSSYYHVADSLSRLLNGNNTSTLHVVNKNIPGFQNINKQLFETDSAVLYRQLHQLDSLFRSGELSPVFYKSYQSHLAAMFIDMALSRFNCTGDKDYLNKIPSQFLVDEYLAYDATGLYKNAIRHFIDNNIGKNNYHRYSAHEITLDYDALYDSCDHYLSSHLLDLARFICLTKIKEYNNAKTLDLYLSKWMDQTADSSFKAYALLNFRPVEMNATGDNVVTYEHAMISFDQLLKKFSGKKIYIDLWASWCLPCINSIEGSRRQISSVDTSQAVVLYLSLDQDHNAWLQSSARLGLTAAGLSSYRIANVRTCHFLEQIKLKTIPRYVLLDRNGKIISTDAPGPDSKGFMGLLE